MIIKYLCMKPYTERQVRIFFGGIETSFWALISGRDPDESSVCSSYLFEFCRQFQIVARGGAVETHSCANAVDACEAASRLASRGTETLLPGNTLCPGLKVTVWPLAPGFKVTVTSRTSVHAL